MTLDNTSSSPDLTGEDGVRLYLADTPFASKEVVALTGGTANFVFRLHLDKPYESRTTLVLKHAEPYVKDITSLPFDLDRLIYEVEALRQVKAWLPTDAIGTVPAVHLFDKESSVVIMDDVGEAAVSLKEFMQEGNPSLELCTKIGAAVGEFLGRLHAWGRGNREVCDFFEGNRQAKRMSSWVFFGRLLPTLTGANDIPKLADPPLEVDENDLKVLEKVVEETTSAMLAVRDTFVMGDFWPGNLMVTLDENKDLEHIYVLDWELCKPGLLGVEIGQFCAEFHLLRRFNPQCKGTASVVLDNFFETYAEIVSPDKQICKHAVLQWGAHLVVLAPRVEWGEKELTREVVKEGVQLLVKGYGGDEAWLAQSMIGQLVTK